MQQLYQQYGMIQQINELDEGAGQHRRRRGTDPAMRQKGRSWAWTP